MAVLSVFEGAGVSSASDVAHEFKEMNICLSEAVFYNDVEWKRLVQAFMVRINDNVCAALNARTNMTLHFGVNDNGTILGIVVEEFYLVRND